MHNAIVLCVLVKTRGLFMDNEVNSLCVDWGMKLLRGKLIQRIVCENLVVKSIVSVGSVEMGHA